MSSAVIKSEKESCGSFAPQLLISDQGTDLFSEDGVADVGWVMHIENKDRDFVIHAEAKGGRVHYFQPFR
jgi:hypothetical protein